MKNCKVRGCSKSAYYKDNGKKGYCQKHYLQMWKYGKILKRTLKDKNKIIDCGDYCEIVLYNKFCKPIAKTKIDKEDLGKVKGHKWGLLKTNYIFCNNKKILLHQFILGKKNGFEIDHINHDKTDCRRNNLRFVTRSQNSMNRKVKGYYWNKKNKKWMAYINKNYKRIYSEYFINEQDAINARRQAEQKYFKEFAFNH